MSVTSLSLKSKMSQNTKQRFNATFGAGYFFSVSFLVYSRFQASPMQNFLITCFFPLFSLPHIMFQHLTFEPHHSNVSRPRPFWIWCRGGPQLAYSAPKTQRLIQIIFLQQPGKKRIKRIVLTDEYKLFSPTTTTAEAGALIPNVAKQAVVKKDYSAVDSGMKSPRLPGNTNNTIGSSASTLKKEGKDVGVNSSNKVGAKSVAPPKPKPVCVYLFLHLCMCSDCVS